MEVDFITSKEKQTLNNKTTECPICGKKFYVSNGKYLYKKQDEKYCDSLYSKRIKSKYIKND